MNVRSEEKASLTLGEAIQRLRESEAEGDMSNEVSMKSNLAFEQHDAVHVLFDCGTSIQDEIAAHVWMLFATTANLGDMHRAVASQEHRTVLSNLGHWQLTGIWLTCLPRIVDIILKSWRMTKRFDVEKISYLRQQSIHEIRCDHGINL